ncbi:MAG TPA: 4-(cytidine 5'-diphospho)-2-C-methyl-D-erythritol kinase [Tissierellaceae bacterium]|nr:4-(cytidine 5'-diphospho)-2-C-methyl-D-erythritol kinase [Tissierellaceae bacterium]
MRELIMDSYGKVNLALDILYKRNDGYHEIKSIMQRISLRDRLIFEEIDHGFVIESNHSQVPKDETNLVYRAWEKLVAITGGNRGIKVIIEKNIPVAAGLAGGSTNGATTLLALNELWDLKLSEDELMKIGRSLGADVPFCIMGATALAEGIGEKLTKLKPFSGKHILLCNPGIVISTEHAYSQVEFSDKRIDIEAMIKAIDADDLKTLAENMGNTMEGPMIEEYPIIGEIKKLMLGNGALGALMSGSGSTVFGLYDDEEKMKFTEKKLLDIGDKVYLCKTL